MPENKAVPRKSRADTGNERVIGILPAELHLFKNRFFKVKDDDSTMETVDSIRQHGALVPAVTRPNLEGGYELITRHRRHRTSELAEKETMPVIIRHLRLPWQALRRIANGCCEKEGRGLLYHGPYHPFQV